MLTTDIKISQNNSLDNDKSEWRGNSSQKSVAASESPKD